MTYADAGYSALLQRDDPFKSTSSEQSALSFDQVTQEISASKVQGGVMQTSDGKTQLNLEQGYFSVNDGSNEIIRLGKQDDDSIGLLIKDRTGNTLFQFTGDINIIQSPNQHFQADFNNERILAKDEGGTPRALFGKGDF